MRVRTVGLLGIATSGDGPAIRAIDAEACRAMGLVGEEQAPGPPTILVIDDEIDTREAVGEALGDEGYTVLLAENGKQGLEFLPNLKRPCGVIVDINMPVMNGIEFYKAMRAEPAIADIPVLISTADPMRAPRGVPLIKKPVHLDRLLAAVAALF